MGAVQSFLSGEADQPLASTSDDARRQQQPGLSWASSKMQRDIASKFSELEMLSLRQVFQQLKSRQDQSEPRAIPGITEAAFVAYLGIPTSRCRAGHLFFRSFCNLSVYPDDPSALPGALPSREQPPHLAVRDFIKPLALYCHKVDESTLVGVKPLKVIFESFAERVAPPTAPVDNATTSGNPGPDTGDSPQNVLQRTRTMEDSLRDLTLHSNFEWDPEDDAAAEIGPRVHARDLVEILDGLFWLVEKICKGRDVNEGHEHPGAASHHSLSSSHRLRATAMVEHLVLYSRSVALSQTPVDLASESIDFGMFSKYVSRNTPNLFEVLSQYFYSLFLIGNLFKPADSGAKGNEVLPGISTVPVLDSPSTILAAEDLALLSWFLPLQKTTPTLTKLYTGSENGFSMNQFEVHVCKYPAPSLLLLLVEQQLAGAPTMHNRRQSLSFGSASSRQRQSISGNSPPYSVYRTIDGRKSSFEKLAGRSPVTTTLAGSALSTIFDGKPTVTDEPAEMQSSPPPHQRSSTDVTPTAVGLRKNERQRMVLGAYVAETWKVSKAGWGNDLFSVFELSPCFEVFPAKKSGPRPSSSSGPSASSRPIPSRARARDPAASPQNRHYIHFLKNVGVGFGGQESESCLLFVDDNLRFGSYRQDFAGGNVYMSAGGRRQAGFEMDFEVVECEVWGLGGPEAKARQKKEWDFEQREANRRASIHLRGKDGEQDIDRDLLEMAGVLDPDRGHRHARRQSAVERSA